MSHISASPIARTSDGWQVAHAHNFGPASNHMAVTLMPPGQPMQNLMFWLSTDAARELAAALVRQADAYEADGVPAMASAA